MAISLRQLLRGEVSGRAVALLTLASAGWGWLILAGLPFWARMEAADILRAYNRVMELDQLNSEVRRRARHIERQKEAWKRAALNYAVSQAPRYGLECSLPSGDQE